MPSIYGDHSDPDGDGVQNLLEYGLGASPWTFDRELLPPVVTEPGQNGSELWRMTYWASTSAEGVTVEPQVSADLIDWTTVAATPTGARDGMTLELEAVVDITAATRQFIRLHVRRSE